MIDFGALKALDGLLAASAMRRLVLLPIIPLFLIGFHYRDRLSKRWHIAWYVLGLALVASFGMRGVWIAWTNIWAPPDWDLQIFWLYGRAVTCGLSPYEPSNLLHLAQVLQPRPAFAEMLFCFHPPPTLFLWAPLGWMSLHTACMFWYGVHGAVLLLDIYLLWSLYQRGNRWAGLLFVAALFLMLRCTLSTIYFGQVNFLVLLMLLLFWRSREQARCGVWLALGILVKPLLVFVSWYPLLRQRFQAVLVMAGVLVTSMLLAAVTFGHMMVITYFVDNPIVHDVPDEMYTQAINQSLLATTLRLTEYDLRVASPYRNSLFVVLAIALTGITVWRVVQRRGCDDDWTLGLLVAFALLIFPKTLDHYSVLLVIPLLSLWAQRAEVLGGLGSTVAVATFAFAMVGIEASFVATRLPHDLWTPS